MLLLLFVYFLNIGYGKYTYWKYGDNSRVLPETQRYFECISSYTATQSKVIDVDWLRYPVITSDNDILVHGYNQIHGQITLYQFDQHLILRSKLILASNVSNYTIGSLAPIYHEYENNNYYIHYLTLQDNNDIYGKLLVIKIQKYAMNILWEFNHDLVAVTNNKFFLLSDTYQPLAYNGYIWFQHKNSQTERSFNNTIITRYLFNIHNGSVIWNKTDYEHKYETYFTPITFDKYNQISVIYGNGIRWYQPLAAALCSFDFMTGDLNWCRNYSDYYTYYQYFEMHDTSAIYHEYDLLIQGGHLETSDYGFSHISAFNLSDTGNLVSYPLVLYDWPHPFVFNSKNGRNNLIAEFPGEDMDFGDCPYRDGNKFLKRMYVQIWDPAEDGDQFTVHFDRDGRYPDESCEYWLGIKSPIDSYSSLISSVETRDSNCSDNLKIFVVTNEGRGNMICSPGDFPMIPNQDDHDDIETQLMYFVNHDGNRIVAHYNYKDKSATIPIIWIITVPLALIFAV